MQRCNKCNSTRILKHGIRKNKYYSNQVYHCNNCKGYFTPNFHNTKSFNLFKNKTYKKEIIIATLNYFCKGWSYQKIVESIEKEYKYKISKSTAFRWVSELKP